MIHAWTPWVWGTTKSALYTYTYLYQVNSGRLAVNTMHFPILATDSQSLLYSQFSCRNFVICARFCKHTRHPPPGTKSWWRLWIQMAGVYKFWNILSSQGCHKCFFPVKNYSPTATWNLCFGCQVAVVRGRHHGVSQMFPPCEKYIPTLKFMLPVPAAAAIAVGVEHVRRFNCRNMSAYRRWSPIS